MMNNIEAAINLKAEILDTYAGMLSMWDGDVDPDGRWNGVCNRIDDLKSEIAALEAQYNRELAVLEGDAA